MPTINEARTIASSPPTSNTASQEMTTPPPTIADKGTTTRSSPATNDVGSDDEITISSTPAKSSVPAMTSSSAASELGSEAIQEITDVDDDSDDDDEEEDNDGGKDTATKHTPGRTSSKRKCLVPTPKKMSASVGPGKAGFKTLSMPLPLAGNAGRRTTTTSTPQSTQSRDESKKINVPVSRSRPMIGSPRRAVRIVTRVEKRQTALSSDFEKYSSGVLAVYSTGLVITPKNMLEVIRACSSHEGAIELVEQGVTLPVPIPFPLTTKVPALTSSMPLLCQIDTLLEGQEISSQERQSLMDLQANARRAMFSQNIFVLKGGEPKMVPLLVEAFLMFVANVGEGFPRVITHIRIPIEGKYTPKDMDDVYQKTKSHFPNALLQIGRQKKGSQMEWKDVGNM